MNAILNDIKDLKTDFGTTALRGCMKALVTPPVLKPFEKTEWKDEHGTDYDVSNPVFEARSVAIPFYAKSELDYQRLIAYLETNIENKWTFEAINRSYLLRLTGSSNVSQLNDGWWFTLTFSEDKPMDGYVYSPPMMSLTTGYTIDDVDFGYFGVRFLKGYFQEMEKPFPVKQNLQIASTDISGLEYPNKNVYFAPKAVKLQALFRGQYILQMLDALVWTLSRPQYRIFRAPTGETFPCIYKSVEIVEIEPYQWLKVNINLEFQIDDIFDVLIDANGSYLTDTENNTLTHILQ